MFTVPLKLDKYLTSKNDASANNFLWSLAEGDAFKLLCAAEVFPAS